MFTRSSVRLPRASLTSLALVVGLTAAAPFAEARQVELVLPPGPVKVRGVREQGLRGVLTMLGRLGAHDWITTALNVGWPREGNWSARRFTAAKLSGHGAPDGWAGCLLYNWRYLGADGRIPLAAGDIEVEEHSRSDAAGVGRRSWLVAADGRLKGYSYEKSYWCGAEDEPEDYSRADVVSAAHPVALAAALVRTWPKSWGPVPADPLGEVNRRLQAALSDGK